MSQASPLVSLRDLRARVSAGQIPLEAAQQEFERLTYLLSDVSAEDERELVSLVNALERITFTRLPENQSAAFDEVFRQADLVFERCS